MKKIIFIIIFILALVGGFFYFRYQLYFSHGTNTATRQFEIKKGEETEVIGVRLEKEGFISSKYFFYYYLKTRKMVGKILPGKYALSEKITIPEIATVITTKQSLSSCEQENVVCLTFIEGLTVKEMAELLQSKNLPGVDFSTLVARPEKSRDKYSFLKDGSIQNLEGYLFPDTYSFYKDASAEDIVDKMLATFEEKALPLMEGRRASGGATFVSETIIMASVVEKEVATKGDMKIVSGIFKNRLDIGMPLQSDATLSYYLDDDKDQHQGAELTVDTPYNTYRYKGLPPGPVCNPGANAITAALNPEKTDYLFFLTDRTTKETIFSKTFEEHVRNKSAHGL